MAIALILFYLLFPFFILYLTHKSTFLNKIGAIVIAYISGLVLGNTGILPHGSEAFKKILAGKSYIAFDRAQQLFQQRVIIEADVTANHIARIQNGMLAGMILLAIPLILFSLDFRKGFSMAKSTLKSLALALLALVIAIATGFFIFKNLVPEAWQISGMLVGLYTGGTPNLAALSTALNISASTFILAHTYDVILSAFSLLFLMTFAQKLFGLLLPPFRGESVKQAKNHEIVHEEEIRIFWGRVTRGDITEIAKGFTLSALIAIMSGGISLLAPQSSQMIVVVLSITTLGLLAGQWKFVRNIRYTFQSGMYFIIIFSLVVSSMADLRNMFHVEYFHLFAFVLLVMYGTIIVHVLLSAIFRIDTDTTVITITAMLFSPPFVPVVAGSIKNKDIIIPGITVGIIGYAIGNYLGLAIAYFLTQNSQ